MFLRQIKGPDTQREGRAILTGSLGRENWKRPSTEEGLLAQVPSRPVATKIGELLQGVAPDGSPILVTATSNDGRFSVTSDVNGAKPFAVTRLGKRAPKAEEVVRRFAELQGLNLGLAPRIELFSNTPVGKGRASSSQDQQRVLTDIVEWFSIPTTVRELYRLMCAVERSDFLFRPLRLIHANPVKGTFQDVAKMPSMVAVVWDDNPDGVVLTGAVAHLDQRRGRYASVYKDLLARLANGDAKDVMAVSTNSATLSQALLPKRSFDFARGLAARFGGGVVVAHTGTIAGVLLPPERERVQGVLAQVRTTGLAPVVHTLG